VLKRGGALAAAGLTLFSPCDRGFTLHGNPSPTIDGHLKAPQITSPFLPFLFPFSPFVPFLLFSTFFFFFAIQYKHAYIE
jgi:hypothetical protein